MKNIIEVEFCKMEVKEHIRKQTEMRMYRPRYTFDIELFVTWPKIPVNAVLFDIDNKNMFTVKNECNGLYKCTTIKSKKHNSIRKPKRVVVLSIPHNTNTGHLVTTEDVINKTGFNMDSLDKQINGQRDMLCLVYDDSNKMYCDLLKSSDSYDIRIVVKKK